MYQVSFPNVFFFVKYMHICTYANQNALAETLFRELHCLHHFNMTMFVGLQSFISLSSFMFFSAAVRETRESNRNKEKEEKINKMAI